MIMSARGGACQATSFEDDLIQNISMTLKEIGSLEVESLRVTVDGHDVVIEGPVSSYYLRQRVEFAMVNLPLISTFHSHIEVTPQRQTDRR